MTEQERNALGQKLTELSVLYDYDLPKPKASMYINIILKYFSSDFSQIMTAIDRYVGDPKNKKFPAPVELKNYLDVKASYDSQANEVAQRIRKAVTDIGWCSPVKAKEYIGELGWTIVQRSGGWQYICENLGVNLNVLTFHAQVRDAAKSALELAELGMLDKPIAIPQSKTDRLESSGQIINLLGLQKPERTNDGTT